MLLIRLFVKNLMAIIVGGISNRVLRLCIEESVQLFLEVLDRCICELSEVGRIYLPLGLGASVGLDIQ